MKFIERIDEICEQNNNVEIYLDMDGTIIELLFDIEKSYTHKGKYIKKSPIKPVIEQIEEISRLYPNVKISILSFSRNTAMTEEKNQWLDINMPFISKENRFF